MALLSWITVTGFWVALCLADLNVPTTFACGTSLPSPEYLNASLELLDAERALKRPMRLWPRGQPRLVIGTYFHVVTTSRTTARGFVTASQDKQLFNQLAVLNAGFAPSRISFKLLGITRTINPSWSADRAEMDMKRTLRQGGYNTLNAYFIDNMGQVLGRCTLPELVTAGSYKFIKDGCTVALSTVPGGSSRNFNLGATLVHETGHWFGLLHTFQGGCDGPGDFISDTPPVRSASYGCPIGRHSCPRQPGLDPIHNYMDYSYELYTRTAAANAWVLAEV
ncbi:Extracellular metalloprotease-like protein 2 [Colletotrichum chlorophyti]|uniref:Extracellular metalloprotease-like protein 2 n=1 Tax=Colletotrichum chlorophyti TaxID=708187 RepID=A0A1Q8S8P4_9PEZI|nr:Extracellular metalloprotease-like protein 2 [Colletotrichum chlorophyti]